MLTQIPRAVQMGFRLIRVSPKTVWVVLRVRLGCGAEGWAEITDFGDEAGLALALSALGRAIANDRPSVPGGLLALVRGRQGAARLAVLRHGLEAAAADALARRAGVPLAVALGGGFHDRLDCYANINRGIADRAPAGFAARAAEVIAAGYRAVKIAPFDGYLWDRNADPALFSSGVARVEAVRDAIGPDARLMIDCHSRFSVADARRLIDALASCAPYWIEDPVDATRTDAGDQRAIRRAAHGRGIRIAGGEDVTGLADAMRFLAIAGHDVILPDLRLTGLRGGICVLEAALARGVAPSLHNPVGPVLDGHSRHLAAAMDAQVIVERQVGETPLYDAIAGGAEPVRDGRTGLGSGGGFGFVPQFAGAEDEAIAGAVPVSFAGMAGAGPDS
ncbi:enolase C-terminal domain-like protein [Paracoccus lutimaris]|uniref:Galactonate dehydratase n=1 Tax=Paracoccus lutimaris TaxID=1490030 RepID=A0A368Z6E4_9RHOB|nr:enolase C-terminal domain-like protein [Paracoccus lutimaris]RCW86797.1 galactonate dehydratase [Paracoccus lutimaris]